ncbi:MAG: glycosyltransferase family 4 protein [Caldilineae bacterium]|nr:glycosyltransferase family 4 protein [Chloroflexota bacterium]MCB9177298.1 glycosyltransferase family 4 protein [Caldilineae bacterium]
MSQHLLIVANDAIGTRMAGPSIRAWELAGALHAAGVQITLAAPGQSIPSAPFATLAFDVQGRALRPVAERADAVLVQGLVLAHYPFLAALDIPVIVDVYDPFVLENLPQRAEETLAGRKHHHVKDLAALNAQLERGDFFVCASEQQRDFWLGMLTALGRVGPEAYDADASLRRLLDVVPFGLPTEPPRPAADGRPRLKGGVPGIDPGDEVILWGGGIWNWFDPLTLIRAVAELAPSRPRLRLFFLGGKAPGLYTPKMRMAAAAERLARELGLLDRVVFFNRDWVPYAERGAYLLEADLAASTHLPHIETRFAFRTRLLDCIWAGLPMLVTEGDVLAELVQREGLGLGVPPEDVPATAAAIAALLDEPDARASRAEAFARVRARMTWTRAAEPLARFMAHPERAPDRPEAGAGLDRLSPTPAGALPARALEILREGGPLALVEEAVRYLRWMRRPS